MKKLFFGFLMLLCLLAKGIYKILGITHKKMGRGNTMRSSYRWLVEAYDKSWRRYDPDAHTDAVLADYAVDDSDDESSAAEVEEVFRLHREACGVDSKLGDEVYPGSLPN